MGADLERELVLLERERLARLLRHATAIRLQAQGASIPVPIEARPLEAWRADARRALEHLSARAAEHADPRALGALVRAEPRDWPRASDLAEWARRLEDGEIARLCLGLAWLHEGDLGRAERTFTELLRRLHLLRHRWRVLEGLGHVHAELGRWRLAHAALEVATESPRSGVGVFVEAFHMARRIGEPAIVTRSAARLDLLIDPLGPEFQAALDVFARRFQRYGALPPASGSLRRVLDDLQRARSAPSGRAAGILAGA